jgi:hypothetical protein
MDFLIPAGGATNLPKELVDKIVAEAVEKSLILRMVESRGQFIEIVNEGTVPVIGEESLDRVYRIDNTADITTLNEMTFDVKSPDLAPVELGTYIYLKSKQVKQYPQLQLESLFRSKIARAIARTADKVAIKGDTGIVGATNPLTITDGIELLASSGVAAAAPVGYTTSNASDILDAVAEAQNALGVYGEEEDKENLVIFASPNFLAACKKSADKLMVGYDLEDVPALGLKNVVHLHGIPVIKRMLLTGEKAVMANMSGAFAGYFGNIEADVEHKAGRRADLLVVTYWFDFKWALTNGSGDNMGLVTIEKTS